MSQNNTDNYINVDNLLDLVAKWTGSNSTDGDTGRSYFRGETIYDRNLIPSLLRKNTYDSLHEIHKSNSPLDLQEKLLRRYSRYTSHLYHAESDFHGRIFTDTELLCLAQHNGLPTLLIDWSLNPLVALYFAMSHGNGTPSFDGDSCFYAMKLKEKKDRSPQTIHLEDPKDEWEFKEKTKEFCPLVVVPLVFTRRISAQSGRFIYAAFLKDYNDCIYKNHQNHLHAPWSSIEKYRIRKRDKLQLLARVRALDIHEGRMFPDMGGWAKYLSNGGL